MKYNIESLTSCILQPSGLIVKKRYSYYRHKDKLKNAHNHVIFNAGFDEGLKTAAERISKNLSHKINH